MFLTVDVDLFSPDTQEDWYPTYDLLREEAPVWRMPGTNTFVLTRQEAVTALNKGQHSVLALVRVHADDSTSVRYVRQPLDKPIEHWQTAIDADWNHFWNRGTDVTP